MSRKPKWQSPILVGPNEPVFQYLISRGVRPMTLVPLSSDLDLILFREKVERVRQTIPTGVAVDVPSMELLRESKVFLSKDGRAGGAVSREGRLYAMFRLPDAEIDVRSIIGVLVSEGATHLSCLDTFLPRLYSEFGFYPVYRQVFDHSLAPDWDPEPFRSFHPQGTPDSVKMERTPGMIEPLGSYSYQTGDLFSERWSGVEWWAN